MFLKIHRAPDGTTVVALCDCELINTTISDGEIDVCITEAFYGNRRASDDEIREALSLADNANIMGERAVSFAVDMGVISRSSCIMIGKVPHAQVFRL
ncbi:MAG: hypothetical protein A4E35_01112 [Methanoregula sp. PtaU1.Bin051]|nr:MAG: hypothetical protein A4E35_01112 [Methanoregula sp. PtaU1.Bin051]